MLDVAIILLIIFILDNRSNKILCNSNWISFNKLLIVTLMYFLLKMTLFLL